MLHIRLALPADFAPIAALTNWLIANTAVHFGYVAVTAQELQQLAAKEPQYPWLVADVDGAFAGYAKGGPWRAREAYSWTVETGIYLNAVLRGRGIGRALYERLLAVLAAQGFRSAVGGIALPNEPSVRLHEALGFRACGVVREAGCKHGRWHDVGFWQLPLRDDAEAGGELRSVAAAFTATM